LSEPDSLVRRLILAEELVLEVVKAALLKGISYFMYQPGDEAKVMDGSQSIA